MCLVVGVLCLGPVTVGARRPDALAARLAEVVREAALGERIGIAVLEADSGREVFVLRADLPLNPASNTKLLTAATALRVLGPTYRFRTALHGRIEPDGSVATLYLHGTGDPSLRHAHLFEMAERLADRGVRRVEGVAVDASWFDAQWLPPAFEQQPEEAAAFRAAVSAVAVDRASYVLSVLPSPQEGIAATVRVHPPGHFALQASVATVGAGPPKVVAVQRLDADHRRTWLRVRGEVPAGGPPLRFRRRVEHPAFHAAEALREMLGRAGIRVGRRVELATVPPGTPMLASHDSEPLALLLHPLGKWSDNFVAEMLTKAVGASERRPGTTERGMAAAAETLRWAGANPATATLRNGSGLFDANRLSARHLAILLSAVYRDPGLRDAFLAHLAVGGAEGTLRRRLRDLPAPRIVRAKTGTLADVISLSGYVLGPRPGRAYVFSVLMEGVRGRHGAARALADTIARTLAEALWEGRADRHTR